MRIVGLTGGIAVGKTTISSALREYGIPIVDCDQIAFDVVRQDSWGYRRVVEAFGKQVLQENGDLDRSKLRNMIIKDKFSRLRMNKATHLPIAIEMAQQLFAHWRKGAQVVVLDAPLLFEAGLHRLTSKTITVSCEHDTQMRRLMQRDSMTPENAELAIGSQMSSSEKRRRSDVVIHNDGSIQDIQDASRALAADLLNRGSHPLWEAVSHPVATLVVGVGFISGFVLGQGSVPDSSKNT